MPNANEEVKKLADIIQGFVLEKNDILHGKVFDCISYVRCMTIAETLIKQYGYRLHEEGKKELVPLDREKLAAQFWNVRRYDNSPENEKPMLMEECYRDADIVCFKFGQPKCQHEKIDEQVLRELCGLAIGKASMCWKPRPKGVFDSTLAAETIDQLVEAIKSNFKPSVHKLPNQQDIVDCWNIVGSTYHQILRINGKTYYFMNKEDLASRVVELLEENNK